MSAPRVLSIERATFVRDGRELVAPFSLELDAGGGATLESPNPSSAAIAARMAAGIVKPSVGRVVIGDFETRLQPAQAKRLAGFVAARPFALGRREFRREVRFRADVWDADPCRFEERANAAFERFAGYGPLAYNVALALAGEPLLIVLEAPVLNLAERIAEAYPHLAVFASALGRRVPARAVLEAALR